MTKKKAAPADKTALPITEATPSRKNIGGKQVAFVSFKGQAPKDGAAIKFTAINGATYRAKVKTAVEVDGVVTCELSDGPHHVATK